MNEAFALHYRIFTRADLSRVETARRILKAFTRRPDTTPETYGQNEPPRGKFDKADLDDPAQLLSDTALSLIVKRSKPRWQAYLNWQRRRWRPWFWTLDFGDAWLRGDAARETAGLALELCELGEAVFAAGALSADWFAKHDVLNPETGELRQRTGASFEVSAGLPGIYWFTFLGAEAMAHLGRRWLADASVTVLRDDDRGTAFLAYNRPDENTPEWRREQEAALRDAVGAEYFFDLANAAKARPRRRKPIPGATDATTLRG